MPEIIVIPSWNIPKLVEDQKFVGTIRPDAVYRISFTNDKGNYTTCIVSIENVTFTNGGCTLHPAIEFGTWGFATEDLITIDATKITEIERVYLNREVLTTRPESNDEDPFSFTFFNSKTNAPFTMKVDHDHFVGVVATTKKGNIHTYMGYIDRLSDDGQSIVMLVMSPTKGIFKISEVFLPVGNIRGIFNYELNPVNFDDAIAEKKSRREARIAKENAVKESADTMIENPDK